MSALYLLVPLALIFTVLAVALFIWAVRSGQYDDLDTPAVRILFEDLPKPEKAPETPDRSDGS